MFLLYSLLLTLGILALLPLFLLKAVRHGKYVAGLGERMGGVAPVVSGGRPIIWLHCVSVGETQAARPLVRALRTQFPTHALVISTITLTGQRLAREVFRDEAAAVFYFPFDWAWCVRRTLRAINPAVVLVLETELWPRFLRECQARGVPVALVNGRLSERSLRGYRKISGFIRQVVNMLALAIMQTEADAARLAALGLAPERIRVAGNLKFDAPAEESALALTDALRARFGFADERPLILAASTHAAEEAWLLAAFKSLRNAAQTRTARLLIAPRHPERFDEVAALVASSGLTYARRSAAATSADPASDVILLDSIGELRAVYPLAALVFVGGSLVPTGGHNVLEPAVHARCIVTGAHTFNFAAIVRDFLAQQALVQLPKLAAQEVPAALARTFQELLADDERRCAFGTRALAVLTQNRGATARTVELLKALIRDAPAEVSGPTVQTDHAPLPPGAKTRKADIETRLTSNF
ncbi:MAG TPA: 3-deoxy-D-manno-octulosonic acid transferase [Pyrinomonadaceae bacterium]|jgi:3-deoxy-D-manno-octulosonic-acid transferase